MACFSSRLCSYTLRSREGSSDNFLDINLPLIAWWNFTSPLLNLFAISTLKTEIFQLFLN